MVIYTVEIININQEILNKLLLWSDLDEKTSKNFLNIKDSVRTMVGEILIRSIVAERLGIKQKQIKFKKNKYGKPYLEGYSNFNFNISHSGNLVVCALDEKPIGIDIEQVKNIEYKDVVKSFFSENEKNYVFNGDISLELDKFYEIWTLKESYLKCIGQGLSVPLNSFSIELNNMEDIKVISYSEYKDYKLKMFNIGSSYKMAVCSVNSEISNNVIKIDGDILINSFLKEN
ncbi:4'-phosphopantetheinyl transferase superfamily protein [Bacillus pseudomycoides]|uniref:4'-phosphopantetheinyl transferase family protein n=1 Tax=Bacillus TaxID=1386 RepID=UPI0003690A32|nr:MULTISPECIES: 4'-phosphopantetheinyl transferase superfamily protein [Bacillus]MCX2829638.1 4'-phosphopantetheinyl transferase superfamily protein [Bacillus sp. DHT2]MDR4916753.1 4'-phosphopantetheinyl transferase superfamily protein [Bacillus pseudomycoides]